MAEPKVRFKRNDGSSYLEWNTFPMSEVFTEVIEKNHPEMPVLSVQQGVGTVLRDTSDRSILYDKSNLKNYKVMHKDDYIIHLRSFEGGLECSNYNGISSPAYRILRSKMIIPAAYRDYFRSYEFIHNKLAVAVVGIRDGKNIDMDTFWQIPMTIACLEEQQKIADFLSSVDEVIAASEQEVANLETQKKTVMKKIFSQQVRFKREDGSDFPEWEERDLVELFPYIRNGFVGTITDFFTEKENGIRYLQGTNIHDGIIADNVEFYVTNEFHQKQIKNELKEDDIIMVQSGHVGDCAVVGKKYAGSNCHALIIMSNAGNCCSDFYVAYFHSPDGLREIAIKATGNTVKHILASVMQGFRVPYPCLEEQRLIADFLSDFDEAIAAAKKELKLWKELKKGLLQQMFV